MKYLYQILSLPPDAPIFRRNFLPVTPSPVMQRNQNFVTLVTGHRVRRIDWIGTVTKDFQGNQPPYNCSKSKFWCCRNKEISRKQNIQRDHPKILQTDLYLRRISRVMKSCSEHNVECQNEAWHCVLSQILMEDMEKANIHQICSIRTIYSTVCLSISFVTVYNFVFWGD